MGLVILYLFPQNPFFFYWFSRFRVTSPSSGRILFPASLISVHVLFVLFHVLELGSGLPLVAARAVRAGIHLGLFLGHLLAAVAGQHVLLVVVIFLVPFLVRIRDVRVRHRKDSFFK